MVEMKSTRELVVGDVVSYDDLEATVTESKPEAVGWVVSLRDNHTGALTELDVDPTDVDAPIWETRYPRP